MDVAPWKQYMMEMGESEFGVTMCLRYFSSFHHAILNAGTKMLEVDSHTHDQVYYKGLMRETG
jgi:hypothetical protein